MKTLNSNFRQHGSTLVESMVALLVMSFGILGLAHFQFNMLAQSTDAQQRLAAAALSEEMLSYVRADLQNLPCYTQPQVGLCASDFAQAQVATWTDRAAKSISGFNKATLSLVGTNQVTVTLSWLSKSTNESRHLEVTTDVRQ